MSKFRLIVLFVLVALVLTSCGQKAAPAATTGGTGTTQTGPVEEFVIIALNWQLPYWNDVKTGA